MLGTIHINKIKIKKKKRNYDDETIKECNNSKIICFKVF